MNEKTWQSARPQVLSLRAENPLISAKEMADIIGVSRERIRQILLKHNLPTKVGRRIQKLPIETITLTCLGCSRNIIRALSSHRASLKRKSTYRPFCSKECMFEYRRRNAYKDIILKCACCGRDFIRTHKLDRISRYYNCKRFFCSRECYFER